MVQIQLPAPLEEPHTKTDDEAEIDLSKWLFRWFYIRQDQSSSYEAASGVRRGND